MMPLITATTTRPRALALSLFCVLVLPLIAVVMVCQAICGSALRSLKMAVAIDQCGNAGLGGSEDETISSRSWRAQQEGKTWGFQAVELIDFIFGAGHCQSAAGY